MLKRNSEQNGIGNVTLSSGDGTLVITLSNPMPDTSYSVQLTFGGKLTNTAIELWSDTKTKISFKINVISGSSESDIDVNWKVNKVTQ